MGDSEMMCEIEVFTATIKLESPGDLSNLCQH